MKLHIGCGTDILEGYQNLDMTQAPGVDLVCRLGKDRIPMADESCDEILAFHILEHINDILHVMQELYRVAEPGCKLIARVPYGATATAWDDPTHVRAFFPSSFSYFSQPAYHRADYGYTADWKIVECTVGMREELLAKFDKMGIAYDFAARHFFNVVEEMTCVMEAVKPARPRDPALYEPVPVALARIKPDDFGGN